MVQPVQSLPWEAVHRNGSSHAPTPTHSIMLEVPKPRSVWMVPTCRGSRSWLCKSCSAHQSSSAFSGMCHSGTVNCRDCRYCYYSFVSPTANTSMALMHSRPIDFWQSFPQSCRNILDPCSRTATCSTHWSNLLGTQLVQSTRSWRPNKLGHLYPDIHSQATADDHLSPGTCHAMALPL